MRDKANKDKTTMTTREVGVLIEELRSQFRTFGEDLSAIKEKVGAIFDEQGRQKEDIFIIKADIAEIKSMLKNHDKRIARLEVAVK